MNVKELILTMICLGLIVGCNKDLTPPTITIVSPLEGADVSGVVTIKVSSSDDEGKVKKIELFIDGNFCVESSESNLTYEWDTAPLEDSSVHTLIACAWDEADNEGADTVQVFVNWPAVWVDIISPIDGSIVEDTVTIKLEYRCKTGSASKAEFYIDDTLKYSIDTTVTSPDGGFEYLWLCPPRNDGEWCKVLATVYDDLGNMGSDSINVQLRTYIKWRFRLDYGQSSRAVMSSPAIGNDGTIYVGSGDRNLYAINPDGSVKWTYATGDDIFHSPVIATNGTVYISSSDVNLYAINPDGSLQWSCQFPDETGTPALSSDGSIYVDGGTIMLYAMDQEGNELWSYNLNHWPSSPSVGRDGTIFIGQREGRLFAITPDGSLKWETSLDERIHFSVTIDADGTIYAATVANTLYAIDPTDGNTEWIFNTGDGIRSSPAIDPDGTLYFGCDDDYLYALNPDGSLKWKYQTDGNIRVVPAVSQDGIIYFATCWYGEYMYALNSDGSLKWKTRVGFVITSPTIGPDGTIYVVSEDGYIYALKGSSHLASSPWPMYQHDAQHTGRAGGP